MAIKLLADDCVANGAVGRFAKTGFCLTAALFAKQLFRNTKNLQHLGDDEQ
jgi:hypothetical protein